MSVRFGRPGPPAPYNRRPWSANAPTPGWRPTGRQVRFGDPIVDGGRVAAEFWATMREEGQAATLIGCSFLTFTPDGLVATGRDYWFLEPGIHAPYDGWGG